LNKKYSKLVNRISESGITHAFGIPGGGDSLQLIDALNDVKIPFYRTHHEAAAAIMAGTIGHLSGNPALSISIKGPGLTNMLPGIALCHYENYPLLAVCESYDEKSPKLIGHKGIDQDGLVNTISKGSYYYNDDIKRFESAFNLSKSGASGPVLINLAKGSEHIFGNTSLVNEKPIQTIATLIEECRKPVIIAGSSLIRFGLSKELSKLDIPIFSTLAAKGIIDENLDYSAGIYTGAGKEISPEHSLIKKSDLIIGLGIKDNELLNSNPFHCKSINISLSNIEIAKEFDYNLFNKIETVRSVLKLLLKAKWGKEEIKGTKDKINKYLLDDNYFLPAVVYNTMSNIFDGNYRVILDTGYFCTAAEHIILANKEDRFLCSANSRYMGTSIPMGIASSLYDPSIPSIVYVGDGGIGMYISDMKIAVENNLPIIIMLLSDGGFGSIRKRSIPNELIQSPTNIIEPSWIKFFESFGIKSFTVDSLSKLKKAMTSWVSGPLFIECFFDEILYMNMVNDLRD